MKAHKPSQKNGEKPPDSRQFRLYDRRELAAAMGVTKKFVTTIETAGAPFVDGKTHPEWILKWLKEHASDPNLRGRTEP
jgi:DNA-binding XRE family transcriptional regulator